MSKMSDLEKEVMLQIQKNITLKNKISLNDLAQECHVSKSTVVKLAKKLGYSGYVEMIHKMYSEHEWSDPFQSDLIEGDLGWTVRKLAQKLREFAGCKNIIAKSLYGDYVCSYYSRKLQMFDIFAADTYDYEMILNSWQKKGFALFLSQNNPFGNYSELMRLAQKAGYYIIVFATDLTDPLIRYSDYHVIFKKNQYKTADFINAQRIGLLEMVLSEYSRILKEEEEPRA